MRRCRFFLRNHYRARDSPLSRSRSAHCRLSPSLPSLPFSRSLCARTSRPLAILLFLLPSVFACRLSRASFASDSYPLSGAGAIPSRPPLLPFVRFFYSGLPLVSVEARLPSESAINRHARNAAQPRERCVSWKTRQKRALHGHFRAAAPRHTRRRHRIAQL